MNLASIIYCHHNATYKTTTTTTLPEPQWFKTITTYHRSRVYGLVGQLCWSGLGSAGLAYTSVVRWPIGQRLISLGWPQLFSTCSLIFQKASCSCSHDGGREGVWGVGDVSRGLGLELRHCCPLVLLQSAGPSKLQGNLDSKNREIDSTPWWEELPSHITCGVGRREN